MIDNRTAEQPATLRRIFTFLLFYRWLSLSVPLVAWALEPTNTLLIALLVATAVNSLISFFSLNLNRALRRRGQLLIADLILMATLIAFTGGWGTPFYLHALNPLLIAAFFFGMRGAIIAASVFLPFYAIALLTSMNRVGEPLNWLLTVTAVVGFYLISGVFGYAASLLRHLQKTRDELLGSHRKLNILHELTLSLQSAADVDEVQEKVLEAITSELGFHKAVIGLVDPNKAIVTGWLGRARHEAISRSAHPAYLSQIPLTTDGGPIAQALLERRILNIANEPLNQHFEMQNGIIFPLLLREHAIGVLLVETEQTAVADHRFNSLEAIAGQAAVAIGATLLCINRAQQIAVQDERIRIAQDLHDTVSQSLFGIVFMLDGSLKLLPDQPEIVKPELERALETAELVRQEIRHTILDIWPSELTAERFTADLQEYAHTACSLNTLQLEFDVRGAFSALSPQARRNLYRISQEALANISRHAFASEARICVDVADGRAQLVVRDNGKGFDTQSALAREYGREHFGLRGIQQRAQLLGGECHIFSQPGEGASIIVDIPVSEK